MQEADCCIVHLGATHANADHKERGSVPIHAGGDPGKEEQSRQETKENDDADAVVEQDKLCIGDEQGAVLDQYPGGEKLEELLPKEGNAFYDELL